MDCNTDQNRMNEIAVVFDMMLRDDVNFSNENVELLQQFVAFCPGNFITVL